MTFDINLLLVGVVNTHLTEVISVINVDEITLYRSLHLSVTVRLWKKDVMVNQIYGTATNRLREFS